MGLQSLDTSDKFKDYVLGLAKSGALATEAGAQQYTALLALAEAFAKTHAATVDLTKSEQEIADERKDLQQQYDELTMNSARSVQQAAPRHRCIEPCPR
jgi:septal ring factor EnvC (AmiA/AmiB activator)